MDCVKQREKEEKGKEISTRQCENVATMKRGTKTSTVITVVAAAAARTSDVWRGWIVPGEREGEIDVGDGLRGYEEASYGGGGRDTWRAGRFRRVVSRISGFYSSRFVFLSAMVLASRVCSGQPCSVASLARFDLPFFGISPRTRGAVLQRIELKCDLSISVWKSTEKRSRPMLDFEIAK